MRSHAIRALVAAASLAILPAMPADAVLETEPNETVQTADVITEPDSAEGERTTTSDVDTFRFTGLIPRVDYVAVLDNPFLGLAWLANNGGVVDSIAFQELELDVVSDGNGEVLLQVCGRDQGGFYDCSPTSVGGGLYELSVPEPTSGPLAVAAVSLLAWLRRRRRPPGPGDEACAILARWVVSSFSSSHSPRWSSRC